MKAIFSQFRRRTPALRFELLLRPQLDRLYRLAYRFTGAREDAEDLVQELCVRLFPRLEELRRLDPEKAFESQRTQRTQRTQSK